MLKIRIKKWLDSYSADDIKLPRITAGNVSREVEIMAGKVRKVELNEDL